MTTKTVARDRSRISEIPERVAINWITILVWALTLVLFGIAVTMRLYDLALPFDRDGYDEGVYWQTLRAMSEGHPLYQQTFYSQPPMFLLPLLPIYVFFGETLWAARFGIVLFSLLGLAGVFLLGKTLRGWSGALAALLLLVIDPVYLEQSQTLQAEAPAVAFSLFALAMAFLWWERPTGRAGFCFALLCGVSAALGILSKLLAFAVLVPVGLLLLAHGWRARKQAFFHGMLPALVGLAAFLVTSLAVLLPFTGIPHSWQELMNSPFWQQVVTFHTDAQDLYTREQEQFKDVQLNNIAILRSELISITAAGALYGTVMALIKRDWRVLVLLAWLLASIYLLWRQTPLFYHHLVTLVPPLVALTVFGIPTLPAQIQTRGSQIRTGIFTTLTIVTLLTITVVHWMEAQTYYLNEYKQSTADFNKQNLKIARDLSDLTQPGDLIISDAQFLVALAGRSTPPSLVDTSLVRINTGYLTAEQLIKEASQPGVKAVFFFTPRLYSPDIGEFRTWVMQHFRPVRDYGEGRQLWVKIT